MALLRRRSKTLNYDWDTLSHDHLPLTESQTSPGPRQSKTTVARASKRPAAFPGLPSY